MTSRSGERGRGVRGGLCASLLAAAIACLALASSASALSQRGHVFAETFAGQGSGDGQLKEPAGVAVSEATGDIYVVDAGNNRVVEFGPKHEFIRTWGWGVKDGNKEFEICTSGCRAGIAGHAAGELHGAQAIAIDQNTNKATDPSAGDVYVETVTPYEEELENGQEREFERTIIEKYQPDGTPVAKGFRIKGWKEPGISTELFEEEVHGLTVGVGGNLYVYNEESVIKYTNEERNKFTKLINSEAEGEGRFGIAVDSHEVLYLAHEGLGNGEPPSVIAQELVVKEGTKWIGEPLIEALNGEQSSAVAVDEANNNALVDNLESVAVYDPSGELVERIGEGQLHSGSGIAATRSGEVLVADAATGQIDVFKPEPPGAPKIEELSIAEVESGSAKLEAQIDPAGLETTYAFRYDTAPVPKAAEPCSGACVEVPLGEGKLAAAFADAPVSEKVEGLTPATHYHYSVVARNTGGTGESPEQRFRTPPVVLGKVLPDNRVWELVSPLQKNGASIEAPNIEGGLIQASENGARITYIATGAFPGAEGNRAPEVTQVLAARGEKQWSNTDIDTPQVTGLGVAPGSPAAYRAFSGNLETMLVQPFGSKPLLSPLATEKTPYIRSGAPECLTPPAPASCFDPVLTSANVPAEAELEGKKVKNKFGEGVESLAANPSMTHLILQTGEAVALSSEPVGRAGNLYDYYEGAAHLVSILPNGKPAGELPKQVGEVQETPHLGAWGLNIAGAVSSDGSRVVWTTSTITGGAFHLYVRDMARGETVRLDVAEAGAEPPTKNAHPIFLAASADGSHVFFRDEQRLTTNSTADAASLRADLYDCHLVVGKVSHKLECKLTDLSVDPHAGQHADVRGTLLGAGADGNTVYFVANGALSEGASLGHCAPNEEAKNKGQFRLTATCNLYVERYDPGSETWGTPKLVAVLSAEDEADWSERPAEGQGGMAKHVDRVSPDGNYLTFVSDRSLTGYRNKDVVSGKPDTEVFLYDAGAGHLTCVSCNPTGARPKGVFDTELAGEGRGLLVDRPLVWAERWISGTVPAWTHLSLTLAPYASRALFNDGRMFFQSAEALVPQDKNGKEDVYEFEPPGVGGCTTESETYGEASGGCVSLISSGTGTTESAFLDASATGNDAFLLSSVRLAPADTDSNFDVYDARICGQPGEEACLPTPQSSPPPCDELERPCKASATEPGTQFAAPASRNANGSTNSSAVEVLGSIEKVKPKTTNAQKLKKALTGCRKLHKHNKRAACERKAIFKYGTRAQKLSAALKSCHAVRNHNKRKSCEAKARKRYPKAKPKKATHRARTRGRGR